MNEPQTWVEALNINPELLAEWSAQASNGMPILVYCIEQGHVDYSEYMQWAQQHFGLPVLQAHFFQTAFDAHELEQAKLNGDWQPWIFPVEQWEGVTFVACVEPPQEPESTDIRYILADPRAMREAWGGTEIPQPVKKGDAPPPLPAATLTAEEMPQGLTSTPKPFVLELENPTFNTGAITEPEPKVESPAPPPAKAPTVAASKPTSAATAAAPVSAPISMATSMAKENPPELKIVAPAEPTPSSHVTHAKKPTSVKPAALSNDEDEALKNLFTTLRERYSAALIMKCGEQSASLYKHDDALSPSQDTTKTTVNLSYPTFMRIVAKTNLPYHGYLVDSPAHQEFFTALGLEPPPTCVTAIPVRFDHFLWGMVIAFGSEENQKMDSLNFAQEATERLIAVVGANWSKAS